MSVNDAAFQSCLRRSDCFAVTSAAKRKRSSLGSSILALEIAGRLAAEFSGNRDSNGLAAPDFMIDLPNSARLLCRESQRVRF